MIYLDNAATTYPKPEAVYKEMDYANRNYAFNAGRGSYKAAQYASKLMDETKSLLLKLVNADAAGNVAFSPSITIALNEIIQGIDLKRGDNIYVSPYEHNAVARVCNLMKEKNEVNIIELPIIEGSLEIDLEKTKYLFSQKRPKLVCCTHISNVTGYILPVHDIFVAAKTYDAVTVLDTAQSLGLIEVDAKDISADFIAFAGHKALYGPIGIGGIINVSEKLKLNVVLAGGTGSNSLNLEMPQNAPERYEYASPNIVAIAGLKAALQEVDVEESFKHEKVLTDMLSEKLSEVSNVTMYRPKVDDHIGVVSFNIEGYTAEDVGTILDQDYEIAVRTGYHCAPYIHKLLKDEKHIGTVRVGIGRFTTIEEIDTLVKAVTELSGE